MQDNQMIDNEMKHCINLAQFHCNYGDKVFAEEIYKFILKCDPDNLEILIQQGKN
jgi:hypothetical protein